jgi:hypothetical protein
LRLGLLCPSVLLGNNLAQRLRRQVCRRTSVTDSDKLMSLLRCSGPKSLRRAAQERYEHSATNSDKTTSLWGFVGRRTYLRQSPYPTTG